VRDGTEEAAENEGEADDNNCGDRLNHVFRPTDVLSFGSVRVRVRACASTKAGLTSGHRPFFRGMVGMISTDKGCKKKACQLCAIIAKTPNGTKHPKRM